MKRNRTKKSLLLSVISLLLCVSMFAGSTYAWFTDEVTSGTNQIIAGNLDVELEHTNSKVTDEKVTSTTGSFFPDKDGNTMLWEPGAYSYETFKISNVGTLAFKYQFNLKESFHNYVMGYENAAADEYSLLNVLRIKEVDEVPTERPTYTDGVLLKDYLDQSTATVSGTLLPGATATATKTLVLYWPESSEDNNWNLQNGKYASDSNLATDSTLPYTNENKGALKVDFALTLVATQVEYENDSFDDQYDKDAQLPVVSAATSEPITSDTLTEDLIITSIGDIKSATIPAAVANAIFDDVKDPAASENEVTITINATKTNETTTSAGTTIDLDIDMTALIKSTTGTTTTTTTEELNNLSNYVSIDYYLGTDLANVTATHKGQAMHTSAAEDTDNVGWYEYNPTTGILTIHTKTFSPFEISYAEAEARIADVYYTKFNDAWTAAKNNANEVVLLKDLTFNAFYAYGTYTLNLNGHTLTMRGHSAVSGAFGTDGGGNYVHTNLTIKNGTLNLTGTNYSTYGIYNYGTLTLKDLTINSACETVIYSNAQEYGTAGTTTLDNVKINSTHSSGTAVALYALKNWAGTMQPTLNMSHSEVVGAYNAVMVYASNATITDSTITANNNNALWASFSAMASGVTGVVNISDSIINAQSAYKAVNAKDGNVINQENVTINIIE